MSEAARTGRDELYAEAAATFGAALERLARGYERDPDRCLDLLQDIHIALWRSLARFEGRCSLRTWVYRVAHNTATSRVLRPRRDTRIFAEAERALESIAATDDEERAFDERRTLERVYELIHTLRPLDRQVMLLYLEDVDAAAIAEITGLSAANVATKVHRIKQLMVRQFQAEGRDGG